MPEVSELSRFTPMILSVVGLQNSGKTTLVSQMVSYWSQSGLRLSTIKHDGHADASRSNDWEKPDSDTVLHAKAGAVFTMVAGGGQTLLHGLRDPQVDQPLALCARMIRYAWECGTPLDAVLVEGYKHSSIDKVVPLRRASDVDWLRSEHFANVRAVVCSDACMSLADDTWPVYHETDVARLCDELMQTHRKSIDVATSGS